MTQLEIDEGKLLVEQGKLKVAEETLALEREKHNCQSGLQNKTLLTTAGSIIVSTVVAVAGLLYNAQLQRDIEHRKASDDFKLNAAQIVMNSNGVQATREKSKVLQTLFPRELGKEFGDALPAAPEPGKPYLVGDAEPKELLIKLLAEHPAQRDQIIKDWLAVFTDEWPRCLQTPNTCH